MGEIHYCTNQIHLKASFYNNHFPFRPSSPGPLGIYLLVDVITYSGCTPDTAQSESQDFISADDPASDVRQDMSGHQDDWNCLSKFFPIIPNTEFSLPNTNGFRK